LAIIQGTILHGRALPAPDGMIKTPENWDFVRETGSPSQAAQGQSGWTGFLKPTESVACTGNGNPDSRCGAPGQLHQGRM